MDEEQLQEQTEQTDNRETEEFQEIEHLEREDEEQGLTADEIRTILEERDAAVANDAALQVGDAVLDEMQVMQEQSSASNLVALDDAQWQSLKHDNALLFVSNVMVAALCAAVVGVGIAQLLSKRWG